MAVSALIAEGDVHSVYLGTGKTGRVFGALRLLRVEKNALGAGRDGALLACTQYFGDRPAELGDPALRRLLPSDADTSSAIADEVAWVDASVLPPSPRRTLLGRVAPTREERDLEVPHQAENGWAMTVWALTREAQRYDAARIQAMSPQELAAAVKAQAAEEERRRAVIAHMSQSFPKTKSPGTRRRTRGSTITKSEFWHLLKLANARAGDSPKAVDPLVESLSSCSKANIREFDEMLAEELYRLDRRDLAAHAGDVGKSNDGFLYARCFVVSKGRATVESVLADPSKMPKDRTFESLLYAATRAYSRRTGHETEWSTHFSSETGSNSRGWR